MSQLFDRLITMHICQALMAVLLTDCRLTKH